MACSETDQASFDGLVWGQVDHSVAPFAQLVRTMYLAAGGFRVVLLVGPGAPLGPRYG